ncbi:MAG: SoxR reducing system RseC family protein [Granulosicoccaceae bacterium]|jgi:sigma-E factor negative regulatory protein RseC
MIEETVSVVAQDGQYVWVEATSRSACSSCGSGGSCGTSVLGGLFKQRKNYLRVIDSLDLRVGEQAIVGMEELALLKAAFFAYLVPVLLMVVTSISASSRGMQDSAVMLLGMFGLVAGFLLVRSISKRRPGGLVTARLLRRVHPLGEQHTMQFINLERNAS